MLRATCFFSLALCVICPLYAAEDDVKKDGAHGVVFEEELQLASRERLSWLRKSEALLLATTPLCRDVVLLVGQYLFNQQPQWIPYYYSGGFKGLNDHSARFCKSLTRHFSLFTIHKGLPVCKNIEFYHDSKRKITLTKSLLVDIIAQQSGIASEALQHGLACRQGACSSSLQEHEIDLSTILSLSFYLDCSSALVSKKSSQYSDGVRYSNALLDAGFSLDEWVDSMRNLRRKIVNIREHEGGRAWALLADGDRQILIKFIHQWDKSGDALARLCERESDEQGVLFSMAPQDLFPNEGQRGQGRKRKLSAGAVMTGRA